ncbi:MAG TPA: GPP34 family phosphoprotein [Amycolatopsis sp.]|nr:GPP34 family phosphoprotein [Amycolatopsis sp.]
MNPPETLPARMFLLAFDPQRHRLTARGELGYLLRAAALADLVLNGHLTDAGGKAAAGAYPGELDPVLFAVWEQVSQVPPRSWRRWVSKDRRRILTAVRDQLVDARVLRLEQTRFLGLFPCTRLVLREPYRARRLGEQVGRAVRGGEPAARVEQHIAALAALASAGQLRVALGGRDRRRFKARIAELGAPVEPIATALRRAIATQRAAAASGG